MKDVTTLTGVEITGAQRARSILQSYGLYIFLVLLVIVASLTSDAFLTAQNTQDILKQAAPLGIAALGQTFVILTGGFDLSVASLMATVAVMATQVGGNSNAMVLPIFLIAIFMGIAVGGANGWLVTKRRVSPFLATLATMIVLQGLRFAYTKGAPYGVLPPMLRTLGQGNLGWLPVNIIALAVFFILFAVLLYRTSYGRRLYLVGGNRRASYLSGINSDMTITIAYMSCSVLSAMAGLVLVGYVGNIDNWVGRGYELDSIAAVIMGGASFKGGKGGLWGSIAGVLVLMVLFNFVLLLGLPVQAQYIVKGAIIILASAFYLSRSL